MSQAGGPVVEVLNTGSELLLGDVVNTHLATLAARLAPLGLRVSRQVTVPDGAPIRSAMSEAIERCEVLLVTGGLGPTSDDVTREVTAELLGLPPEEDASVAAAIRERLARRGGVVRERMRRQAMVPRGAEVLANPHGTAPGLYLPPLVAPSRSTPHIFLLPGPPRELLPMLDDHLLPRLRALYPAVLRREKRVYQIFGMGESAVEELVGLEIQRRGGIEVGYCARPNEVDLRLIGEPAALDAVAPLIESALGVAIAGTDRAPLAATVLRALGAQTLATAESCTGGLVASLLTDVPGASASYRGGYVVYASEAKVSQLGVPASLIAENGAVSAPVAAAMAEGALARLDTGWALSLTGIAGPEGGTPPKPQGTVHIGIAAKDLPTETHHACFPGDREHFKRLAAHCALDHLRRRLIRARGGT